MKSFCELSCTLLFLCGCLFMSVDCQKKNKGTSSPLVLEKLQNATVMEGEGVVLRCRALNDPNATSRWIKRNSGSAKVINYRGTELVIKNAVADTGIYICMVRSHIWLKLVDVWVTVKQTTTTTTTTTTEPPITTITSTTTTAGLQICYSYNLNPQMASEVFTNAICFCFN